MRTVGILIFDDVEVLDFCGPFEVFSSARPDGETGGEHRLFEVFTVAIEPDIVRCCGGLLVQPRLIVDDNRDFDILVVPGGPGTRRERLNSHLLDWIVERDRQTELTTSVCTGAFLLAGSGLLDGRRATTHWGSIEWMRENYPLVEMLANMRVVDEGHIITSAGVSAGIDMALHVVERLHGLDTARWTARRMEYDWAAGG